MKASLSTLSKEEKSILVKSIKFEDELLDLNEFENFTVFSLEICF